MPKDSQAKTLSDKLIVAGLVLLFALTATPSNAQNWSFSPQLAFGAEYDDNSQLSVRTDNIVQLEGLLVEGRVDLRYDSETTQFLFTPIVLGRNYSDEPDFDSTRISIRSRFEHDTPKNRFAIDGRFDQDTVRNAERADQDLDEEDPDNIPDDDTGLVLLTGDRDRWAIRPSWTYRWTDISSTRVSVDYRDVTYDDVLIFLDDYTDLTLAANYQRRFTDRTAWIVNGAVRRYEAVDGAAVFENYRVDLSLNSQLTPTSRLLARVGVESVERTETGLSETVPVGELTFIRQLETIRLLAQYRRSVSSSGAGRMAERDAINLNLTRQLHDRFSTGIGVRAYISNPITFGPNEVAFSRDYVQLTARFTWNISRTFAFQTSYRYTILNREILGESANSNQVLMWLIFRPAGDPNR